MTRERDELEMRDVGEIAIYVRVASRLRCVAIPRSIDSFAVARDVERDVIDELLGARRRVRGVALALTTQRGKRFVDRSLVNANEGEVYEITSRDVRANALLGGGGDGGATGAESRSAYLDMYADRQNARESIGGFVRYTACGTTKERDLGEEEISRWFTCALTEENLGGGDNEVVACALGRLYNKEPVLKALRDRVVSGVPMPKRIEHITGMKALVTCKFTKRRKGVGDSGDDGGGAVNARDFRRGTAEATFACPITDLDFNGKTKFVVLRPSGVVVADKALREAREAVEEMNDGVKLADAPPPIPVNPRGDELELLRAMLDEEKAKNESKKKKKDKKSSLAIASEAEEEDIKRKSAPTADGERAAKKRFVAIPDGADSAIYASLFTSSDKNSNRSDQDFMTRNARKAW